jgi:hypothetical protein
MYSITKQGTMMENLAAREVFTVGVWYLYLAKKQLQAN